jgi:ABC-type sugar transport system permease subunit
LKILKYDKSSWIYIAPVFAFLLFIYGNPLFRIFWYSFITWSGLKPTNEFNGLNSFIDVFTNRHFLQVLFNNLLIIAITIPLVVLLAIFFAQFIYLKIFGYQVYRYLFFLPVIIPNLVVAIVWTYFLHKTGPINSLFNMMGLDFLAADWFGNVRFSIFGLIITLVWKDVGFALILFLSKLSTVDPFLYDAAKVDGVDNFQALRYITVPQLMPVISLYIILDIIDKLNFLFSYIFMMTRGGPGYSSTVLEYLIYSFAFTSKKLGLANSVAVILFVITLILVIFYFIFAKVGKEVEN